MAEDVKVKLLAIQREHLDHAQQAHRYMQACIADAKAVVGDRHLGPHEPLPDQLWPITVSSTRSRSGSND